MKKEVTLRRSVLEKLITGNAEMLAQVHPADKELVMYYKGKLDLLRENRNRNVLYMQIA